MNLIRLKIKTERLILKPISYEFTEEINMELTLNITRYMKLNSNEKIEIPSQIIKKSLEEIEKGNVLQMVIINNDSNEFIGLIGLYEINTLEPFLEIWTKKESRKKGYGLEAVNGLLEWADKNLKFNNIYYSLRKKKIIKRKRPDKNIGYKVLGGS
jgi:RimJ/RimL family protein N-acetyltransferase